MSAAELRSRRRARILMNSDERLKKLETMHSNTRDECCNASSENDLNQQNHDFSELGNYEEKSDSKEHSNADANNCSRSPIHVQTTAVEDADIPVADNNVNESTDLTEEMGLDEDAYAESQQSKSSNLKVPLRRTLLMVLSGIMIRLAIASGYVQTIVYPFITLQVSLFGFYHFFDPNFTGSYILKSGLWISLLRILGIDQNLIETYGLIMGFINLMLSDFAIYLFMFVITHVILYT